MKSTTPKVTCAQFVTDHQGGERFSVAKSEGNKLIRTQETCTGIELQESLFNSVAKEHSENIIGGDLQLRNLGGVYRRGDLYRREPESNRMGAEVYCTWRRRSLAVEW